MNYDIFSDEFIKQLHDASPGYERNKLFVKQFNNLNVIDLPTHGVPRIGAGSNLPNPKDWINVDNFPPREESLTLQDYLNLIPEYEDPFEVKLTEHNGVLVVRDDLLPGNLGSKARYAEALVSQIKEKYIFYAMVPQGQALKVLAATAKKYNKIVVAIAPLRNEPTEGHIEAMNLGAILLFYQTGGMAGARKRCRDFIKDQLCGNGLYIPAGVKHPLITAGFAKTCAAINEQYKPYAVFSVASTMVMNHGMQLGFPQSKIFAIQVAGNKASQKWPGRATIIEHDQPFNEPCRSEDMPPFPSIPEYDAKGFKYAVEFAKQNPGRLVLFWNVAGPHAKK